MFVYVVFFGVEHLKTLLALITLITLITPQNLAAPLRASHLRGLSCCSAQLLATPLPESFAIAVHFFEARACVECGFVARSRDFSCNCINTNYGLVIW
jgi:hypothetical protein